MQANLLKDLNVPSSLHRCALHHVQSFDHMLNSGLTQLPQYIPPVHIFNEKLPFKLFVLSINSLRVGKPLKPQDITASDQRIFPTEARLSGKTYGAPLFVQFVVEIDGQQQKLSINCGNIPVMVRSQACHLHGLSPVQLVEHGQDSNQFGGYFIINGNQKVVRMLIMQKQNYPVAFTRNTYCNKGAGFTMFAVQSRCVREDFHAKTITLHYINDGNITLRLLYRKQEFLIPLIVIIRGLEEISDLSFRNKLLRGRQNRSDLLDRIQIIINWSSRNSLSTQRSCLQYIGSNFRSVLGLTSVVSDRDAGQIFLNENICVHLKEGSAKVDFLILMVDKLFALVSSQIEVDNLDSLNNHEVLLGGHLYQMVLKELLQNLMQIVRAKYLKDAAKKDAKLRDISYFKKTVETSLNIGSKLGSFLSTGTIRSQSGLDLQQDKGFVVIADKLNNYRFLSHFRSIHRGAYFAQMKTTTVRKLRPQSYGFLCPVHTPDGAPCGLLSHITINCRPLTSPVQYDQDELKLTLSSLGMVQARAGLWFPSSMIPVVLDGKVIGYVLDQQADNFASSLRHQKVAGKGVPKMLQIAYLRKLGSPKTPVYPMIFLGTTAGRFTRPVKYLPLDQTEFISPLEQMFLRITNLPEPVSLHSQLNVSNILSILPHNIPFMNHNQSPRNMYQCQMNKQTLGSALLNYPYRADNKIYRILVSQLPLVRTKIYQQYGLNFYGSGVNAVVAVLSYTGYDMEDAMIINKSSWERGLGAGLVYKTISYQFIKNGKQILHFFKDAPENLKNQFQMPQGLDQDGLCKIGTQLRKRSPLAVLFDVTKETLKVVYNKQTQPCKLDQLNLISNSLNQAQKLVVKLRFDRRGVIGDKFSSRHGQKGVLSLLYPSQNMPFTQSGIVPDIIINPHAFPSRMTIGMLLESLVAKTYAIQGKQFVYQHWQEYQQDRINEHFGNTLLSHGFKKSGSELMHSGITGLPFEADIFIGVVYYQRLRHMVSDKSQARATGPCDILTQQPLKGRKKGGGIRVGEMQRDAFLSHGLSFAIHERLFKSSDYSQGAVCRKCGSIISCYIRKKKLSGSMLKEVNRKQMRCQCGGQCQLVAIPFVLRYLVNQLAVMGVAMKFHLE